MKIFDSDVDDVTVFTCGCCHVLAQEIHHITGWPIFTFWNASWHMHDVHAFVRTPWNTYLDILGEHTPKDIHAQWNDYGYPHMTIRRVKDWGIFDRDGWNDAMRDWPFARDRAKKLAKSLVRKTEQRKKGQ